jgi:hypothetical protein
MGLVGVSGLFAFFFSRVGLGYWVICCFGVGYSDVGAIFFLLFLIVNEQNLFSESAVCWACGWLVGKEIKLKSCFCPEMCVILILKNECVLFGWLEVLFQHWMVYGCRHWIQLVRFLIRRWIQLVRLSLGCLLVWLVSLLLDWLLVGVGVPWFLLVLVRIFLACIWLSWKIDKTDNMVRFFFSVQFSIYEL